LGAVDSVSPSKDLVCVTGGRTAPRGLARTPDSLGGPPIRFPIRDSCVPSRSQSDRCAHTRTRGVALPARRAPSV